MITPLGVQDPLLTIHLKVLTILPSLPFLPSLVSLPLQLRSTAGELPTMPSQNASRDFESQKRDLEAQLDYVAKSSELNANQQRSLNKIVTLFRSSSTLKGSNRMRARKTVEFLTTIRKEAGFALFFLCAFSVPQTRIGILSHSEVLALSKKIQEWWSGTQCPQNLYSMAKAFDEKHPDLFEGEHPSFGITKADVALKPQVPP